MELADKAKKVKDFVKEYSIYGIVVLIFLAAGYIMYERGAYETKLSLKDEQISILERRCDELKQNYDILKDRISTMELMHNGEIRLLEREKGHYIVIQKHLEKQIEWYRDTYQVTPPFKP